TVIASSGFHATWLATALRGDALVASADHSVTVSRHARRGDAFDLDAAITAAAADLRLLDEAGPVVPGPCSLWLGPEALLPDGALDFAALSAPVTDDAVAIRSFPLIDRGLAVGLGLSPREAALRNTDPNGGVRNLLIATGTWTPAPSPTTRTIEVRRLHSLA